MMPPNRPSDSPDGPAIHTPIQCVGSASAVRRNTPSGADASRVRRPAPTSTRADALSEPSSSASAPSASSASDHSRFNPGTTWFITNRTHPAWTAALDLLDDEKPHDLLDVRQAMLGATDLAPRTVANHLRSASRRGWISIRRGKVRLRNRQLVEDALDAMDGGRP